MRAPQVLDTSLRDGAHAMSYRFTVRQVRDIVRALDHAGVQVIEVSHGDGLAGGSLQSGFCSTPEATLIATAATVCERARLAVMILPGIGTGHDLIRAIHAGARSVRVATLCMQPDLARRHLAIAKEHDVEAVGFLMLSHIRPAEFLAEQALLLQSYGADCICLADSAGFMLPHDVRARIAALKSALDVPVGFHAHNNLGAAIGNCVAALEAGADRLDGSLRGLGAGAGNAPTELLAAVLDRLGLNRDLDVYGLADAAELMVAQRLSVQPIPDRDSILLGLAGVYSTFLPHIKHAAERHGLSPGAIVAELGRRQPVVGQEDLPEEIAAELAGEQALG